MEDTANRDSARATWSTVLFALLVATSVVAVVVHEQTNNSFLGFVDSVIYAFLACVALAAIGSSLGQSARSYGTALIVVIVSMAVIWYLPSGPREVFADAASRIEAGMSADEVDAVMAGYDAGMIPEWPSRSGAVRTFYSAPGESERFDCFCMVTWADGEVASVQFHAD